MRREERRIPRQVRESEKGRARADYPSVWHADHQRALRIDGVVGPEGAVNVGNADQFPVVQEMTPTTPWMQLVRQLSEKEACHTCGSRMASIRRVLQSKTIILERQHTTPEFGLGSHGAPKLQFPFFSV